MDLFRVLDVRATFFVIARDLRDGRLLELLKQAIGEGHEIANHSLDHHYDLIRLRAEVDQLKSRERILRLDLEYQRSPRVLAARAAELGLVPSEKSGQTPPPENGGVS